jgi:hypothetical protein
VTNLIKENENNVLSEMIHDALRFAMWSGPGIQEAPLQVYYAALLFAPKQSIVRQQFGQEMPEGVKVVVARGRLGASAAQRSKAIRAVSAAWPSQR